MPPLVISIIYLTIYQWYLISLFEKGM
ncbi:hypothetical protein NQ314_018362 [Rhamnusium bicolor]|uniref:Uncharacterized protein n=1 Tax=Rhamnusium bicolor TaxID=1586634 RepID=A0AAV8WR65_9CUCU|nr:hypothetical protein NQ314_018362 [Rhamnusium bicolor]